MGNRMSNIATPMPQIRARFTSKLGIPLSGCKVYTYEPNSNIPKTTWIDIDKTVENTNPILLDAAGEADIFLDGLYQIVVKDRFGFVVYDVEKTGFEGDEVQQEINKKTVSSVYDYNELSEADVIDGQVVFVKKDGVSGEFACKSNSLKTPDGGTVIQDAQGRIWERVDLSNPNIEWWGVTAAATGATNQAGYAAARDWGNANKVKVNLNNKTYNIDSSGPSILNFINGSFNKAGVFYDYDALGLYSNWRPKPEGVTLESQMLRMNGAAPNATGFEKGMIAIGPHTMKNATTFGGRTIAIGMNNMITGLNIPELNLVIGDHCMIDLNNDGTYQAGTRNIAIGQLTLQHLSTGKRNTAMGRNSAANVIKGSDYTCLGYNAGTAGTSTMNTNGDNQKQEGGADESSIGVTAVGAYAGTKSRATDSTFLGFRSGANLKSGDLNTFIGAKSGASIDIDVDYDGRVANYNAGKSGTYTNALGVVTATLGSGHGVVAGNKVGVALTGSLVCEFEVCTVTAVTSTTITFNVVNNTVTTGSGSLTVSLVVTNTAGSNSWGNSALGALAMNNRKSSLRVVALGFRAHEAPSVVSEQSSDSIIIGSYAGATTTSLFRTTVVGHGALGKNIAGSDFSSEVQNATAIGYMATVSANNQVQLGNSSTTVYTYGAVQDRSDIRDKTDIEPMSDTMTQFILELNPVQGRWDMRDDYINDHPENWTDEQKLEWWSNPQKDGSKKRARLHNWFIAQEVKTLAESLGIDFAGLQDHKLIDGTDTLTLGYEEFIPPIVATLQKAWNRMDEIELRLSELEK